MPIATAAFITTENSENSPQGNISYSNSIDSNDTFSTAAEVVSLCIDMKK